MRTTITTLLYPLRGQALPVVIVSTFASIAAQAHPHTDCLKQTRELTALREEQKRTNELLRKQELREIKEEWRRKFERRSKH
jgi:hypothetical protein